MKQVSIHEAKTHLSRLIDAALSGEDVVIARRNQPVVRLSAIGPQTKKRAGGSLPGLVQRMPDSFNDELKDWESPVFPKSE